MAMWPSCRRERAFLFHNSMEEAHAAKIKHDQQREDFERRAKKKTDPMREMAGLFGDLADDVMNMMKEEI